MTVKEKKRTEARLDDLRRNYETEMCELQCRIQRMQMVHSGPFFELTKTSNNIRGIPTVKLHYWMYVQGPTAVL